jgi:hypothetical protein
VFIRAFAAEIVSGDGLLLGGFFVMGVDRPRDQGHSSHQQDQHHQGVEQTGWPKVDVYVGSHARQNEKRAKEVW